MELNGPRHAYQRVLGERHVGLPWLSSTLLACCCWEPAGSNFLYSYWPSGFSFFRVCCCVIPSNQVLRDPKMSNYNPGCRCTSKYAFAIPLQKMGPARNSHACIWQVFLLGCLRRLLGLGGSLVQHLLLSDSGSPNSRCCQGLVGLLRIGLRETS